MKRVGKRAVKQKSKVVAVAKKYDCDDVEKYLKKAITSVKEEILPRLEHIDQRDKDQYDMAKKIMMDAAIAAQGRQEQIEKAVSVVKTDLDEIYAARQEMTQQLTQSMNGLHDKLDSHITDETVEFTKIREGLTKAATHVESIQNTLDTVSANGNKGLSNSMTDIYNKLKDLEHVTQGARARAHFWQSAKELIDSAWFMKPFASKWGFVFTSLIFLVVLNTVLHALGIDMNLQGILAWVLRLVSRGGV